LLSEEKQFSYAETQKNYAVIGKKVSVFGGPRPPDFIPRLCPCTLLGLPSPRSPHVTPPNLKSWIHPW